MAHIATNQINNISLLLLPGRATITMQSTDCITMVIPDVITNTTKQLDNLSSIHRCHMLIQTIKR